MTPSSEEIATALEAVVDAALEQAEEIRTAYGGYPKADESKGIEAAVVKVRAHLSRLREEERFRDAAMVLWCEFNGEDAIGVKRDPYTKAAHAFVSAGVARALEEPRDA